jgi:hypothetical protein
MTEIVKLEEQFAILREGELSKTPVRVLKRGDSFAVFDPRGDIVPSMGSIMPAPDFCRASSCFLDDGSRCCSARQSAMTTSSSPPT